MKILLRTVLTAIVVLTLASHAVASMNFIPNNYGLSARGMGMACAMTAVTDDVGVSFFNPAALAVPKHSRVGMGYLYGAPFFEGDGPGGKLEFDKANEVVQLGLNICMRDLFTSGRGLGFGLNIALDENGSAFIRFTDKRSDNGQFIRYGTANGGIVAGLGLEVLPVWYLGAGALVQLHGDTALAVNTDLAGNAKNESMELNSDPYVTPIASTLIRIRPLNIGLTWRMESYGQMGPITADTLAEVGDSPLATLPLSLSYRDSFIPMQAALGVAYDIRPDLLLAFDFTWHQWSRFVKIVEDKDDARRDSRFDFRDTFIPRIGLEWEATESHALRFGYYYDMTPVDGIGTYRPYRDLPNVMGFVVLDNDKHVGSLGYGFTWLKVPMLNESIKVDLAYSFQYLVPRSMKTTDGYKFESSGMLHAGTLTFSLGF